MSWFTSLFSNGIDSVVSSVGDAIDKLVTSDEERLQLRNELEKELNNFKEVQLQHAENLEQQITDRHNADMKSDSWLSKNIRPLALAFLTTANVLLAYVTVFSELSVAQQTTLDGWLPLMQNLLMSVFIFYFGGRTAEKLTGAVSKKLKGGSNE